MIGRAPDCQLNQIAEPSSLSAREFNSALTTSSTDSAVAANNSFH